MNKDLKSRYKHIKDRCYNPNNKSYHRYGCRGIKMCQEQLDDYDKFEEWALRNGFEKDLAIDRIDNDGDYSPENCRFVTIKENNQKRRTTQYYTINGETRNLQQWCDHYNINRVTVITRLKHGWDIEKALSFPVKTQERDRTSLIGKTFYNLYVESYAGDEHIGADNNSSWVCRCVCGNKTIVSGNKLKTGHTRSCGCLVSKKAYERFTTDNPAKSEKNRQRMRENNPMKK